MTALIAAFVAAAPADVLFATAGSSQCLRVRQLAVGLNYAQSCWQSLFTIWHKVDGAKAFPVRCRLAATSGARGEPDDRGPGSLRIGLLDGLHALSTRQWTAAEFDAIHISED